MVHCQPNTFGNERAAKVLAAMLNEIDNPKLTEQVSRYFHMNCKLYKDISSLSQKEYLLNLVRTQHISAIDRTWWPPKIKSFLKNCLDTKVKQYLKE